jgi:hypothetical protein
MNLFFFDLLVCALQPETQVEQLFKNYVSFMEGVLFEV